MRSPSSRAKRLAGIGLALMLGTAGPVLAVASPAAAAVPGLVRAAATSASNSNDTRSVTATCPAGKVLTGAGFQVNGATGEVVVDDFVPNGTPPTSVTAVAYEAEPFALNWTLTAFAICANPLAGPVRVTAVGVADSNDFKSVTATCPAGKVLTFTGFSVGMANGEVVVDDFRPNGSATTAPTAVTVGAYESEAFAGNWRVIAHGVCVNPLAGLVRISATSASNSNDFNSATATCSATGKVLVSTGYEITGATGEVVVDDFVPNGTTTTPPTTLLVGAYEEDPFAGDWTVTSYGICANP